MAGAMSPICAIREIEMTHRLRLATALLTLSIVVLMPATSGLSQGSSRGNVVFVRIEKSGSQYMCTIDGKQLAPTDGNLPYVDLDRVLGERIRDQGKDQTIAIVIGRDVTLDDAFVVRTVAQKVGYRMVRFFFARSGAKVMSEVVIGSRYQLPTEAQSGELVPISR